MALPLQRFKDWVMGQLVGYTDMLAIQTQIRDLIGAGIFGISGYTAWLPFVNPVSVTAPGGMLVTVGGADELVFLPESGTTSVSKVAYSQGAQNETINPADPSNPRIDLICLAFANPDVNPHTVSVRSGSSVNPTTVYDFDETYIIEYVQGTAAASPTPPAVPTGYVALAQVRVPAGATTIVTGDITIVMPNIAQIIQNYIFNPGGGFGLTAGTGIDLIPTDGPGGQVVGIEIENTGVISVQGIHGAVVFSSPDGSIVFGTSGSDVTAEVAGGTSGNHVQVGYSPPLNSSFDYTITVTLPGTSSDTYDLHGSVGADTSSGNNLSLTGGGASGGGTWNSGVSAGSGYKFIEVYGTAPGGSVITLTGACGGVNGTSYPTLLRLDASKQ